MPISPSKSPFALWPGGVIHENNSQKLWIENRSDTDLFVQSSDLIKGGQQDRMVENDMIVPAHDTSLDLNVYCIEHGRSTKRGAEPVETFSASHWMAPLSHTRLVTQHALTEQLLTPHVGGLTAPDTNELNLLKSLESLPQPFGAVDAAQGIRLERCFECAARPNHGAEG